MKKIFTTFAVLFFTVAIVAQSPAPQKTTETIITLMLPDPCSTLNIPQVSTASVTDISETTAISGGNVTSDGGADITARGVVWSTSENPTLEDNLGSTSDGEGTGEFVSALEGLISSTDYFLRAYATNSEGTSYGGQLTFRTESAMGIPGLSTMPAASFEFDIYPNPTTGNFSIRISSDHRIGAVYIQIVNIYGQQILHEQVSSEETEYIKQFGTSNLKSGIYLVKLIRNTEAKYKRLIIR